MNAVLKARRLVRQRLARHKRAEQKLVDDIHAAYPAGTVVYWRHGGRERQGEVTGFAGHSLAGARFRVRSRTGREYWVYASAVVGG